VFGASEVVHYFTVNGVAQFYLTVQAAMPSIQQLILTGHSAPDSLFAVLIGPVRYFILEFVWRFVTDPISHACWAGLTGYFIGLAATGRYKWYTVGWIGLAVAAILHGLNDWSRVNGHWLWIVITLISGVLFLGYAMAGARGDRPAPVSPAEPAEPAAPLELAGTSLAGPGGSTDRGVYLTPARMTPTDATLAGTDGISSRVGEGRSTTRATTPQSCWWAIRCQRLTTRPANRSGDVDDLPGWRTWPPWW
jgi:hypothetical protein